MVTSTLFGLAMACRLLLAVGIISTIAVTNAGPVAGGTDECGLMFVTVSSLLSGSPGALVAPRLAEITWGFRGCNIHPHFLAVYEGSSAPETYDPSTAAWLGTTGDVEGCVRTNVSVSRHLPGGWAGHDPQPGRHCFPFIAAIYDTGGTLIRHECFAINPTWMGDARKQMGRLHFHSMFLPGTHNSGCYSRTGEIDNIRVRYLLNQEATLWHQLVLGVRYLDFRVGFYPENIGDQMDPKHPDHNETLWVNHDIYRVQPLRPLLKDIRRFLVYSPHEVIVVDFHRFPVGFRGDGGEHSRNLAAHYALSKMVKEELGDVLIPFRSEHRYPMLDEIWRKTGRVVIAYGETRWQQQEGYWPSVSQKWGDKQSLEGLMAFLHHTMDAWASNARAMWAAMAELTPTRIDVFLGRSSLREMADQVNRNITWSSWGRWKRQAMIIACDFIEGTDLVNAAISANLNRSWDSHIFPVGEPQKKS